jgi:hypothetical protein
MFALGFLCGVLLLLVFLYLLVQLGRFWRGQPSKLDWQLQESSAIGAIARSSVRALPLVAVLGTAMYSAALMFVLLDSGDTAVAYVCVGFLLAVAVAFLVLAPLVVLTNRPSVVVPPHLRDEPGLIRDLKVGRGRAARQ